MTESPNGLFSPKEMSNLAIAWLCAEGEIKVDNDRFAAMAGYTKGSASVMLGQLKRKIKKLNEEGKLGAGVVASPSKRAGGSATASPAKGMTTPSSTGSATPKKRGRGKKNADADDEVGETPSKKSKGNKFAPALVAKEEVVDDGQVLDEDERHLADQLGFAIEEDEKVMFEDLDE